MNISFSAGNLEIPNSVIDIGSYAFANCTSIDGFLSLGSVLRSIGPFAFYNCYSITGSLTIHASITYIGESSFQYDGRITCINILGIEYYLGDSAFDGTLGVTDVLCTDGGEGRGGVGGKKKHHFLTQRKVLIIAFASIGGIISVAAIAVHIRNNQMNQLQYQYQVTKNSEYSNQNANTNVNSHDV